MNRYDLAPLAQHLRIELHQHGRPPDDDRADHGLTALASRLGITNLRSMRRIATRGLTERQADHFATRCGVHPASIWPSWWADANGEDDDWYADDPAMADLDDDHPALA